MPRSRLPVAFPLLSPDPFLPEEEEELTIGELLDREPSRLPARLPDISRLSPSVVTAPEEFQPMLRYPAPRPSQVEEPEPTISELLERPGLDFGAMRERAAADVQEQLGRRYQAGQVFERATEPFAQEAPGQAGYEIPFVSGAGRAISRGSAALRSGLGTSGEIEPARPEDFLNALPGTGLASFAPEVIRGTLPLATRLGFGALGQDVIQAARPLGELVEQAGKAAGRAIEVERPGPQVVQAGRKATSPITLAAARKKAEAEFLTSQGYEKVPIGSGWGRLEGEGAEAQMTALTDAELQEVLRPFRETTIEAPAAKAAPPSFERIAEGGQPTVEQARAVDPDIDLLISKLREADRKGINYGGFRALELGQYSLTGVGERGTAKELISYLDSVIAREKPLGIEARAGAEAAQGAPVGGMELPNIGGSLLDGGIVGAVPPKAPLLASGKPPSFAAQEFWARPLANVQMIAGAFKDNFWRSAAQRTGLRQFTTFIDPAALVSGTATDPVTVTGRGLLLRNRVLDVGDSGVNAGMAFLREKPNPFPINDKAQVVTLPGKPQWYDVFDSPGRHKLSLEQTEYVQRYRLMLEDALRLAKENGVEVKELVFAEDRHYIPRLVEAIRGIENERAGRVGGRVGAKAGFQKTRFYEWAEEGVVKGVVYSGDPTTVMEHHVQTVYRLIADKRLADELKPLGETILERVEKKAPGLLTAREISKKEFTRARELLSAVNRAYRGERLPPALVASIERSFPAEAAALKAAGPDSPALQGIEASARGLMSGSRAKWNEISARVGRMKDAVQPGFDEGWIPQPFAQGRIFPKDVVKRVEAALGDQGQAWLRAVQVPSVISRTIGTTIDFGAPFIQGLAVIGENPGAWARATLKHYHAFLDPAVKQRYFTQNAEIVKEMAQYGANVGTTEFFAGNKPITDITRHIPGRQAISWLGRQSAGRFQESFGTFLDVSGVEMWKALRGRALQEGEDSLFALADYVSHARGTMSQRTIGIGLSQQQLEGGLLMFAPRYTKAGFALFADMATLPPYLKGNALRANLSAIIGSATLFFLAGATVLSAMGKMKREEIEERLMPIKNGRYNSKFLTLPIETDNVGMGGFGYSVLRLLAGATDKALNKPEDLLTFDSRDNPLLQFAQSRLVGGAPTASLALELTSGTTWQGEKLSTPLDYAKAVGRRLMPFWAEAYTLQEPRQSAEALPFSFAGQRVFPDSYAQRASEREDQLMAQRGLTVPLNRYERRTLEEIDPELADLKKKAEEQRKGYRKDPVQDQTERFYATLDREKQQRERDLQDAYRAFAEGRLEGKGFRETRKGAMAAFAAALDSAKREYPLALSDRASREKYYQEKRIELKGAATEDIAAEGYYSIEPSQKNGVDDMSTFFKTRKDYLARFDPQTQDYILHKYPGKRFEQAWMNDLEKVYERDQELMRPYWELKDKVRRTIPALDTAIIRLEGMEEQAQRQGNVQRQLAFGQEIENLERRYLTPHRQRYLVQHPEVARALIKWGYSESKRTAAIAAQ